MDGLIVNKEEWPYGVRCIDCNSALAEGAPYSKRLVGFTSGPSEEDDPRASSLPVVEIVCVPCGLGLRSGR